MGETGKCSKRVKDTVHRIRGEQQCIKNKEGKERFTMIMGVKNAAQRITGEEHFKKNKG
jgi:hypothetical protein